MKVKIKFAILSLFLLGQAFAAGPDNVTTETANDTTNGNENSFRINADVFVGDSTTSRDLRVEGSTDLGDTIIAGDFNVNGLKVITYSVNQTVPVDKLILTDLGLFSSRDSYRIIAKTGGSSAGGGMEFYLATGYITDEATPRWERLRLYSMGYSDEFPELEEDFTFQVERKDDNDFYLGILHHGGTVDSSITIEYTIIGKNFSPDDILPTGSYTKDLDMVKYLATIDSSLYVDGAVEGVSTVTLDATTGTIGTPGSIRWNGTEFQGYDGTGWKSLSMRNTDGEIEGVSGVQFNQATGNDGEIGSIRWTGTEFQGYDGNEWKVISLVSQKINRFPNGKFENSFFDHIDYTSNRSGVDDAIIPAGLTNEDRYSGNRSLIGAAEGWNRWDHIWSNRTYHGIPAFEDGVSYYLSFWAKNTTNSTLEVGYSSGGGFLKIEIPPSQVWILCEKTQAPNMTKNSPHVGSPSFELRTDPNNIDWGDGGKLYIDDVVLMEGNSLIEGVEHPYDGVYVRVPQAGDIPMGEFIEGPSPFDED